MTAAKRFRKDYTMGVLGVLGGSGGSSYEPRGCGCNVAALHAIQFARCAAVTAHRAIAEVLGAELTYLLVTLLVEDASFSAMARRFDPGGGSNARAMMSGRLEVLVCLLPTAYARLDRRRGGAARRRRDDLRAAAAGE
jgi:hypothetical protein